MKKASFLVFALAFVFVFSTISVFAAGKPTTSKTLYSTNFKSKDLSDWTHIPSDNPPGQTGTWSVVNGVLQFTVDPIYPEVGSFRLDAITLPESYIIEFDVISIENNPNNWSATCFYTHFVDWHTFVGHGLNDNRIYINSEGYGLGGGEYHPAVDVTDWHHIRYVKDGGTHTLYFDGIQIYSVTGPSMSGGNLVLWANPGIHQYDNIKIRTLPKP